MNKTFKYQREQFLKLLILPHAQLSMIIFPLSEIFNETEASESRVMNRA